MMSKTRKTISYQRSTDDASEGQSMGILFIPSKITKLSLSHHSSSIGVYFMVILKTSYPYPEQEFSYQEAIRNVEQLLQY